MKITRYLWINNLSNNCEENDIRQTFQSHGKIQTIRIHKNNNSRGAIVAFIDCKSSTKAFESVKTLMEVPLKLEYCEANGEPGINYLGNNGSSSENQKIIEKSNHKQSTKTSTSSRSRSNSSNTSSFGSSIDDCSKYPGIQQSKRVDENSNNYDSNDNEKGKLSSNNNNNDTIEADKQCLNKELCGLLIENLSQRSSDTSLREGLFHEYKKHGKITSVTVMGQASGRYAIISFKRSEDMEKAFEASQGKIFFGNLIKAKQHNGFNYIDPDLCPPEHAMDEYHPKATKTLFVGKLTTGSVTESDLKKSFKKFGEIIDIDIKTQSNQPDTSFAFVQYYDISSVVRALRNQDNIKIDSKSVKLGFGKSQPTNCLWIGNLQRNANDAFLRRHFRRYGPIMIVIPDPEFSCALIQFDCVEDAQRALTDTRERSNGNGNNNNNNKRMQVDYASNEYQMAFMNRLRKSCQFDSHDLLKTYADPYQTEKIQNLLISYTKYLGLLEETRPQSFERYENKSDYEDTYDETYGQRQSRHRKSAGGHQRLYGSDNYGLDEEYSDDFRYSKSSARHYDDYSPTHSPVRYSRSSQKFSSEQYNSRKSNYRYNSDYYDGKRDPVASSNSYYPHRRSPDPGFIHSNHNRSYSPSPSSSVDYCAENSRFNLQTKRYRQASKEYRSSRSKVADNHETRNTRYERNSENRSWNKSNRYDYNGYIHYRSKSKSHSRLSGSNSPQSRHSVSQQRSYRNESDKKTRSHKIVNNASVSEHIRLSTQKASSKPVSNSKLTPSTYSTKTSSNNSNADMSGIAMLDVVKSSINSTSIGNGAVSQSADTLSKLERERAKLLQELSMLSEDGSGAGLCSSSKINKSSSKLSDLETRNGSHKSLKKHTSPLVGSEFSQSVKRPSGLESKLAVVASGIIPSPSPECQSQPQFLSSDTYKTVKDPPDISKENQIKLETLSTNSLDVIVKLEPILPTKDVISLNSSMDLFGVESSVSKVPQSVTVSSNMDVTCSDSLASTASTSATNQCRDPRLSSTNYNIRSLSSSLCPLSPVEHNLPLLVAISITNTSAASAAAATIVNTTSILSHYSDSHILPTSATENPHLHIPTTIPFITSNYKDSTSDSDLDHFSNIDNEVDKRIRELDAKLNRSEQTVRTLDYSKFRIRKKVCEIGNCSTSYNSSSGLISSPTCLSAPTPSLSVTSSLLDVGYSGGITRDNNSNTSEFIKTMLNQTKPKNYHLLVDSLPSSDHLTCNYSTVVSTNSSLPFRTVDLGANDIERRTLYSRFGSLSSNNLPLLDTKLSVDTTHLSPTINTHSSKFVSTTSSISNSKIPSVLTISPTATISSTTSTPTILHDSNQPMKSILKKSIPTTPTTSKSHSDTLAPSKFKASLSSLDCSSSNESKSNPKSKSSNSIKRKSQSESEDSMEYSKPSKKIKIESGPTLDDSLFPTYPSAPIKKLKKSSKNSLSSSSSTHMSKYDINKSSNPSKRSPSNIIYSNSSSARNSIGIDKARVSKKSAKINQSNHSNQKSTKLYKDKKKASSKLSINKKSKAKVGSNRKNKQLKTEKVKKSSKRNKEREFYDNNIDNAIKEDEIEDDNNGDLSEFDDDFDKESGSSDNGNYESMYDKIKRRNSSKSASSGKKRRNKHLNSLVNAASSDAMDSDDSEYWVSKSSKKCIPPKRKRARLSDLSSSHFSDSNSCKTTPCGKSQDPHLSSDYSDIKSDIVHQNNFYHMKPDENTKDESVTDESKAPAESFNLSSPHNSSQCSSPKYVKDANLISNNKEAECNNFAAQSILASYRTRSLHRPNDGPLKKRPIAEPIVLSEDLPYLEKQPDDEFITTSPTSINEEPPSQLESMYDAPTSQQTNVLEEVILEDHQNSLDVVEVEYGSHDLGNDQNQIEIDPPLPADVDSASHILMTMKTQPNIELEYASAITTSTTTTTTTTTTSNEPDHQIQSVAEHLISLAQNSIVSSIGLPQPESAVIVTEEEKQSQIASTRTCKVSNPNSKQKDYEVTTYVKNIIDKIKKETDLANLMNKDKLVCKRNKKSTGSTVIGLPKPIIQESSRPIVPGGEPDHTNNRIAIPGPIIQPIEPVATLSNYPLLPVPQPHEPLQQKAQLIKPVENKKPILSEENASTPSTGRRTRHNSAKSDCQLQSLDETIDNVVKSSMSSSVSDAVSNKSTLDGDINPEGETGKLNSNDINSAIKSGYDLTSLEETMNEVIHKMSSGPPCLTANSSAQSVMADSEANRTLANNVKVSIANQELSKQKKVNVNHVKPPMYQLSGNMGSITNLLLGIPSILTVNCQTNALGQNKMPSQLTLPISKLAVSTIQSNIVSASTLVPSSITLHNQQNNSITSVQSTEVMMTKLNSLTPIMIPAPLRNLTPITHNNSSLANQSLIASRPLSNPVCGTLMSASNTNLSSDNSSSKLISVTVPIPNNKPITSPINVVPRSPITPNPGLNLSKMPNSVDMISNYILLQRQVNQTKSKLPNLCQQSTSNDNNNGGSQNVPTGLTASISNTGHSIILSQLTHANSVLSPINTAYLTASVNRTSNSAGNLLQALPTTNCLSSGIPSNPVVAAAAAAAAAAATAQSVILRPINIPFPKFDEKDDWLKQNKQTDLSYPIRWTGKLCLKNDEVFVQMHMIAGNEDLIKNSMNLISNGQSLSQPLRIVQRMRLEPNQLEGLQRRLTRPLEFCTCLTLAGGDKREELTQTSSILNDNFIKYLQEKSAAGIINICIPESQQNAYVIHIFPPCEFSDNQLKNCCSKLYDKLKEESVPYLLVVITTV